MARNEGDDGNTISDCTVFRFPHHILLAAIFAIPAASKWTAIVFVTTRANEKAKPKYIPHSLFFPKNDY